MSVIPATLRAEINRYQSKYQEDPEGRDFLPLANAYRVAGELDLAESLLREGIDLHPGYLSAYVVLGQTLLDRGAVSEAESTFRRALELDAQNLVALQSLAELARAQDRADDARQWLRALISADPMNSDARASIDELERMVSESDADRDTGERAAPGGAPLQETHVPSEKPDAAPEASAEIATLATETLAELYAGQGFADEAAGVYRQLIHERGEEPALVHRLRELEHAAARGSSAWGEVAPESERLSASPESRPVEAATEDPPPEVEPLHEAESGGAAREGEPATELAVASHRGPDLDSADDAQSHTISAYLRSLTAWQPSRRVDRARETEHAPPPDLEPSPVQEDPRVDEPPIGRIDDREEYQAWLRKLNQ